jgi:hypothetical protein
VTYTFTGAVAYDRLGSSWRTAAGLRSVSVTDPTTGLLPTNLVQGGVAVTWLTADANSRYSFTCDAPGVVVDFGAGAEALYANEVPGLAIAAGGATDTAVATLMGAPTSATRIASDAVVNSKIATQHTTDNGIFVSMAQLAVVTPEQFGAVGNGREVKGATITSGTLGTLVDTTNSPFTTAAPGMAIMVYGAGAAGVPLVTTIATRVSATTVTLTAAASTAVANVAYRFGTDDTAAIQAAIDAACPGGSGQGVVQFAAKTYVLATAPRHDRSGNAILAPVYNPVTTLTAPAGVLHLRGPFSQSNQPNTHPLVGGTILMPILPAQTYSATYGPPSVLGGPTVEQVGATFYFTNLNITLENVFVWLTQNPTLAAIDFGYCADATVKGTAVMACAVGQADFIQPTNVWSFGYRMPQGANYGVSVVDGCLVSGTYLGLTGDDHLDLRGWIQNRCYIGYAPSSHGSHPAFASKIQSQECTYHLAGWTVTAGLGNIPANTMVYLLLDLEDYGAGSWYSTTAHVYDPTSTLTGTIITNFSTVIVNKALKVNFETISVNSQLKICAQYVIDCTAIPYGSPTSGSFVVAYDAATWHSAEMHNTSASGASTLGWSSAVDQGTYNVNFYTKHGPSNGTFTVKLNGALIGTIDTYAAANAPSVDLIASVAFPQGVSQLKIEVVTKNASSTGDNCRFTKIILSRVA